MGFIRTYMFGSLIVAVLLSGGAYDSKNYTEGENFAASVAVCALWPVVVVAATFSTYLIIRGEIKGELSDEPS